MTTHPKSERAPKENPAASSWEDILGGGSLLRKVPLEHAGDIDAGHRPEDGQEIVLRVECRVLSMENANNSIQEAKTLPEIYASAHRLRIRIAEDELPTGLDLGVRLLPGVGCSATFRMVARLAFGVHGLPVTSLPQSEKIPTNSIIMSVHNAIPPDTNVEFNIKILDFGPKKAPIESLNVSTRVIESERKILLGNYAFRRGDVGRAQALFSRAIRFVQPTGPHMEVPGIEDVEFGNLFSSYVRAGCNLAVVYAKLGQSDREICELCRSVLSVEEGAGSLKARFQLGRALARMAEYDKAKDCFENILRILAEKSGPKTDAESRTIRATKKELAKLARKVSKYLKKERAMFSGAIFNASNEKELGETSQDKDIDSLRKVDMRERAPQRQDSPESVLDEGDEDVQPVSEVCRRGTCVAKWTGIVVATILFLMTLLHSSTNGRWRSDL